MSAIRLRALERGYHGGRIIEEGEEFIFKPTDFGNSDAAKARTKAAQESLPSWAEKVQAPEPKVDAGPPPKVVKTD